MYRITLIRIHMYTAFVCMHVGVFCVYVCVCVYCFTRTVFAFSLFFAFFQGFDIK